MEFKNARILANANVYFDGNVTSRTLFTEEGERKTLGIMLPGEYEFSTGVAEIMEVLSGEIAVRLAGEDSFKTYHAGESFQVPANAKFTVAIQHVTDYCCSYLG